MSYITTCGNCGRCYEEVSEEQANTPWRLCGACWRAGWRVYQGGGYIHQHKPCGTCGGTGRKITHHQNPDPAKQTEPWISTWEPCPDCSRTAP